MPETSTCTRLVLFRINNVNGFIRVLGDTRSRDMLSEFSYRLCLSASKIGMSCAGKTFELLMSRVCNRLFSIKLVSTSIESLPRMSPGITSVLST